MWHITHQAQYGKFPKNDWEHKNLLGNTKNNKLCWYDGHLAHSKDEISLKCADFQFTALWCGRNSHKNSKKYSLKQTFRRHHQKKVPSKPSARGFFGGYLSNTTPLVWTGASTELSAHVQKLLQEGWNIISVKDYNNWGNTFSDLRKGWSEIPESKLGLYWAYAYNRYTYL